MRPLTKMKLGAKLSVLMALVLLVPLIVGAVFFARQSHGSVIAYASEENEQLLKNGAEAAEVRVAHYLSTVDALVEQTQDAWERSGGDTARFIESVDRLYAVIAQSNPTLAGARLYLLGSERRFASPHLFGQRELDAQPWLTSPPPTGRKWIFDTTDALAPKGAARQLAVLVGDVRGADDTRVGIVEVSVPMATLFAEMYSLPEDAWMGFVDSAGGLHYDRTALREEWWQVTGSVVHGAMAASREYTASRLAVGGRQLWVAGVPLPGLSGSLLRAVTLDSQLRANARTLLFYLSLMGGLLGVCILVANQVILRILARLQVLGGIGAELRRGNLTVVVPPMGMDEIGTLADDLRVTIERFQLLLDRSVERELLVQTTEVRALQTQINSHFIYNALESIKMMAEIKEEYLISDAVTSLGSLLRYSMKWPSSMVSLGEELDYIQNYMLLINLRYDYTVTLTLDVPPGLLEQKIPKMSLQPIIENAIYHGIEGLREDAEIILRVSDYTTYFDVDIVDSGKGMTEQALEALRRQVYNRPDPETAHRKGGIGLRNVHNRIQLSFGAGYGLSFNAKENEFMKVTVRLPVVTEGDGNG